MPHPINASELIGTRKLPPEWRTRQIFSRQARAYHELVPYPVYGMFKEWKEGERGPLPRCWPMVRDIVETSARWLFGRELKIETSDDKTTEAITELWERSNMPAVMMRAATIAGYEGGTALYWTYDEDAAADDPGVRIMTYSVTDHVRFWYHPHDPMQLLMARIQYPYFDPVEGKYFYWREDFTAEQIVVYEPLPVSALWKGEFLGGNPHQIQLQFDETGKWTPDPALSGPNAAGLIPIREIRHIDRGRVYGEGDLWRLFPLIDEFNLTRAVANIDNQVSAWPHRVYIDLQAEDGEEPQAIGPDSSESVRSVGDKPGKVTLLQGNAATRPHIREHARDLSIAIRDAAGYPQIDAEAVTNKGNMTEAVMRQLYAPHIERTEEKRRNYGEYGIAPFLKDMALGLKKAAHPMFANVPKDLTVEIVWPDHFSLMAADLKMLVETQNLMVDGGYTTRERAVVEVAVKRGVDDIEKLQQEIKDAPEEETNDESDDGAEGKGGKPGGKPAKE